MKNKPCPNCDTLAGYKVEKKDETFNVKGDNISIVNDVLVCNSCGESVYDSKLDSNNLSRLYDLYREKHNLLSPTEIISIRESYNLSQRTMSRLLGWGDVTLHRYENGAIQEKSYDNWLRLLKQPENMILMLEHYRDKVSEKTAQQLERRIKNLINNNTLPQLKTSLSIYLSSDLTNIDHGFQKFDLTKMNHMVIFFASKLLSVPKTKMNKLLWYADFLLFKEFSLSSSGANYLRIKYGPVPNHYDLIYDMMIEEELISKEDERIGDYNGEVIRSLSNYDSTLFTNNEITVFKFIANYFKKYSATAIKKKSHAEIPFKKTDLQQIISYEWAKDLSLSLV